MTFTYLKHTHIYLIAQYLKAVTMVYILKRMCAHGHAGLNPICCVDISTVFYNKHKKTLNIKIAIVQVQIIDKKMLHLECLTNSFREQSAWKWLTEL